MEEVKRRFCQARDSLVSNKTDHGHAQAALALASHVKHTNEKTLVQENKPITLGFDSKDSPKKTWLSFISSPVVIISG